MYLNKTDVHVESVQQKYRDKNANWIRGAATDSPTEEGMGGLP